ncbi:hypothetical protein, partial [Planktothrix agardhii]|uniref:hypothetical protein n=1 Tax=Planktothrix agardhii TaxID=1160 RepID=UPI00333F438B
YSSGYVPNFVQEDTAPADLTASVGAIVTQLGFVAFALSGFGNQYKQSLNDLTRTNVEAAKANLRAARDSGLASEETRRQLSQNVRNAQKTTFGQKVGAGVTAGGAGLAIGAPIIAQTIANAIGQETKNARVGSAAAGALGDIGSFAGTGALVAGPKGAAVGALIGALTGLTGVIKQLSTDIPELSAKAKESASNLTQFNEASQRTKTAFEQLQDLRSRGQTVEAGKAEQELIKNIGKDFSKNPDLQGQAIAAVINRDFAGLQSALDKNSESLIKLAQSNDNRLAQQQFVENVRDLGAGGAGGYTSYSTPSFGGIQATNRTPPSFSEEEKSKFKEEFNKLFVTSPLATQPSELYGTKKGDEARTNLKDTIKAIQDVSKTTGGRGLRFDETDTKQKNIIIDKVFPDLPNDIKAAILNLNPQQFNQFVQNIITQLTKIESTYSSIDRNTGKFNQEVQNIINNIGDVKGKFDNFAKSVGFSVALQNDLNNIISATKSALESIKLGNFADVLTQLGDTGGGRKYRMQAGM